jgi:Cof subfamily protein (haloacid dehalogenase superfamily)
VTAARRLAAIDLDGTLLRTDGTVSARSRAALRAARSAGIDVVLVTARSPRSVRVIAADLELDGIALCANGATVFDLDADVILRHRPLSVDVAHRVVRGLRDQVPGIAFAWELELRFGSEPLYESYRDAARWPRPDDSYAPSDALAWREPMTKLLARVPESDLVAVLEAARELCGEDAAVTLTGDAFVEVMAAGVGKEVALAELARERGVPRVRVVAFGDQLTDAAMLRWAGLGVAVANATEFALEAADEVTASNDDDGVALVLERLAAEPQPSSSASVGA